MNILNKNVKDKNQYPKDILMLQNIIEEEGVEEYEKNCLSYLTEFINTYTVAILEESQVYARLCGRSKANLEDIK